MISMGNTVRAIALNALLLATASALLISCTEKVVQQEAEQETEKETETTIGAETGEATHISCRNAVLSGKVTLPATVFDDLAFGIVYSTSSGVLVGTSTQIRAMEFDSEYHFSINTEVLEPETTYYYRCYMSQNKEINYGQVQSFRTSAVSSMIKTLDITDIHPKDAVLNASLNLADCRYDDLEYGFEVTPEGGEAYVVKSDNHSMGKFSVKDETLQRDNGYSVAAYAKLDGRTYKGEEKYFITSSVQASVTAESSDVAYNTATISGKLTVASQGSFAKSAVLYYSSTANTLDALKSGGTEMALTLDSDGSYSISLSSLVSDTEYNYVVVAKVDAIELNTDVKSFTTQKIQASVTAEPSDVTCNTATISGKLTVASQGSFAKSAVLYYSSTANTLEALKSGGTEMALTLNSDGSYSISLSSLVSDTEYNYIVVAKVDAVEFTSGVKDFITIVIPESVDLGLSVKWANFNLGASKPEEFGSYYQFAGTQNVNSTSIYLDYSNCPYHTGTDPFKGWTKYISTYWSPGSGDNKTVLDPSDDVAHIKLGGKWRMPTREECSELTNRDNCTWTIITINGMSGYKVTSRKSGFTDKWIFLPAAGHRIGDTTELVDNLGAYRASECSGYSAFDLFFFLSNGIRDVSNEFERYEGHSVRPVSE